jgi:hypothetical protein
MKQVVFILGLWISLFIGFGLVTFIVFFLYTRIWESLKKWGKFPGSWYRAAAAKIIEIMKSAYEEKQEYREVNPDDFKHLDMDRYDTVTQTLENLGFKHLADLDHMAHIKLLERTFSRYLSGDGGTIAAFTFQLKPESKPGTGKPPFPLLQTVLQVVGLGTDFSDHFSIETIIGDQVPGLTPMPHTNTERMPEDTPLEELLQRHRLRLKEYADKNKNVTVLNIDTIDDVIDALERTRAMSATYKKSMGWVNREDLETLVTRMEKETAENFQKRITRLYGELQTLAETEQDGGLSSS